LSWDAEFEDVKKEIAELEARISALRAELQTAQWAADLVRVQRILAVRERAGYNDGKRLRLRKP
jgi:hypothetical protein